MTDRGYSVADVAQPLGTTTHSLYAWRDVQISIQKNRQNTTQAKKVRVSQSTINTNNSALNRVFNEAMLH
ncbi:MAG: hypothetical protein P8M72_09620 [Gammaproteobacteria bacterium]|nr:hypothetical protein [Gammaproteobacteria bacterium]